MPLGLVTDSTCDLPANVVEQFGIEVVPSILVLEGRQYEDGPGLSRRDFYSSLPDLRLAPTTAAPSMGEFRIRYERLLAAGCEHILSIHAAEKLTAIGAAARQAAADFPKRVTVLDSHSLSLGLGFQVLAAAEAAEEGLDSAVQAVASTLRRLRVLAALDTLTYARRSGRISAAMTLFGSLLHIKPIIELTDGAIKSVAALRTSRQADDHLAGLLHGSGGLQRLAILHTGVEDRARDFLRRIMQESGLMLPRDILMVNVTPVIGAHVGPNALGLAFVVSEL
ncbi:MAG TPA: DegV family protein [Anaerolineales bacterium]|nr:DegV family protein [Anaerolineales bacterium]